jgi:hypothetical protein
MLFAVVFLCNRMAVEFARSTNLIIVRILFLSCSEMLDVMCRRYQRRANAFTADHAAVIAVANADAIVDAATDAVDVTDAEADFVGIDCNATLMSSTSTSASSSTLSTLSSSSPPRARSAIVVADSRFYTCIAVLCANARRRAKTAVAAAAADDGDVNANAAGNSGAVTKRGIYAGDARLRRAVKRLLLRLVADEANNDNNDDGYDDNDDDDDSDDDNDMNSGGCDNVADAADAVVDDVDVASDANIDALWRRHGKRVCQIIAAATAVNDNGGGSGSSGGGGGGTFAITFPMHLPGHWAVVALTLLTSMVGSASAIVKLICVLWVLSRLIVLSVHCAVVALTLLTSMVGSASAIVKFICVLWVLSRRFVLSVTRPPGSCCADVGHVLVGSASAIVKLICVLCSLHSALCARKSHEINTQLHTHYSLAAVTA